MVRAQSLTSVYTDYNYKWSTYNCQYIGMYDAEEETQ